MDVYLLVSTKMDQTVNGAGKRTQNLVRDVELTEGLCWYSREL